MRIYRIIIRDSSEYPYEVQMKTSKWQIFWKTIDITLTLDSAKNFIKSHYRSPLKPKVGSVIEMYTESDFIVDKLNGSIK